MDNPTVNALFNDRMDAGKKLAELLSKTDMAQAVVLCIPSGGEPIGLQICRILHIPLSVVVASKLRYPNDNGIAVAGVSEGDVSVFDNLVLEQMDIDQAALDARMYTKMQDIERLVGIYRDGRGLPDLKGYTVVLVNDGIESGVTMLAAMGHVKTLHPEKIIIAAPVLSQEAYSMLKDSVDDIVHLGMQGTLTLTTGWYNDFSPVTEDAGKQMLEQADSELKTYIESQNLEVGYSLPFHFGSIPMVPPVDNGNPIDKKVM
jgi:putative phosphoribosyl transferase